MRLNVQEIFSNSVFVTDTLTDEVRKNFTQEEADKEDFEDSPRFNAAFNERKRRALSSMEHSKSTKLEEGDLLLFTLAVVDDLGQAQAETLHTAKRPNAEGLLFHLGGTCRVADVIKATTVFVGGQITVSKTWPLSLEDAQEMVDIGAPIPGVSFDN